MSLAASVDPTSAVTCNAVSPCLRRKRQTGVAVAQEPSCTRAASCMSASNTFNNTSGVLLARSKCAHMSAFQRIAVARVVSLPPLWGNSRRNWRTTQHATQITVPCPVRCVGNPFGHTPRHTLHDHARKPSGGMSCPSVLTGAATRRGVRQRTALGARVSVTLLCRWQLHPQHGCSRSSPPS